VLACRLEHPENPAAHLPSAAFSAAAAFLPLFRFGFIFPEHFLFFFQSLMPLGQEGLPHFPGFFHSRYY
jgi:hypothetical protein